MSSVSPSPDGAPKDPDLVFEDATLAQNYDIFRPEPPVRLIQTVVDYWKQASNTPSAQSVLLDVGCGTGQSSHLFVGRVGRLLGVDVSMDQVKVARRRHQAAAHALSFEVGRAEHLPTPPASVDIVTVCAAVHWFNLPAFYAEVDRVLRPGGVLAVFSYLDVFPYYEGRSLRPVMKEIRDGLGFHTPGHQHLETEFASLPAPYEGGIHIGSAEGGFEVVFQSDLAGLRGYYSTFAPLARYRDKFGHRAAEEYMRKAVDRLLATMGTEDPNPALELRYPFFLRMWRKPA